MIPLIVGLPKDDADLYRLVLASQSIPCHCDTTPGGTDIRVHVHQFNEALNAIHLYIEENQASSQTTPTFTESFHKTYSGLFVAGMMFAIHAKLPPGPYRDTLVNDFGSSASHVLDGEVFRLITALFLHGDDMHLAGNMGGILLFGTSVASITGVGLGWFLILFSGILGNGLNALFFQSHHLSIGSSTAIFGAVGILAGLRFIRIFTEKGFHMASFLPLGAGFAILGLLGSSAHSDITAHLFGYLSGLVLGGLYGICRKRPPGEWVQVIFLCITSSLVILAWYGNRI